MTLINSCMSFSSISFLKSLLYILLPNFKPKLTIFKNKIENFFEWLSKYIYIYVSLLSFISITWRIAIPCVVALWRIYAKEKQYFYASQFTAEIICFVDGRCLFKQSWSVIYHWNQYDEKILKSVAPFVRLSVRLSDAMAWHPLHESILYIWKIYISKILNQIFKN